MTSEAPLSASESTPGAPAAAVTPAGAALASRARPERTRRVVRHHWIVRVTHWVAVVAFASWPGRGCGSSMRIPAFHRKGGNVLLLSVRRSPIPAWLTFGGWLGGARNWHFAMMWVLVVNGLIYLGFVYLHGEWRDLVPRRGDLRDSWQMVRFYLFLRLKHPHQGQAQRAAESRVLRHAVDRTVHRPLGDRDLEARGVGAAHNGCSADTCGRGTGISCHGGIAGAAAGHVFMVFAVDPYVVAVDDHRPIQRDVLA